MPDQSPAFLLFLAPFAVLWGAFAVAEAGKIIVAVRGGRQ
jgi:hypothetical protein